MDETPTGSLLTVLQVAEALNVKPRYVRLLLETGRLKGMRLHGGRLVRVHADDLATFIALSRGTGTRQRVS